MPENIGATYSRVSNPNDTREASIESQEDASVKLLEDQGFTVPTEFRFRERHTGMESIYDRPLLGRIRDMASAGKIQAIACYDTDRLARDPNELTIVVRGFHKDGAKPLFVRLDHETTGRVGEMVLYMKGFASAVEWDQIRDRSIRGRQKIYDAGHWVGHGRVRYGYIWDRATRTRSACPERTVVVVRIFEEIASGVEPATLATKLIDDRVPPPHTASWSGALIRSIIKEPTYKGVVTAKQTKPTNIKRPNGRKRQARRPAEEHVSLYDHRTDALVSEELWCLANAALTSRPTRTRIDMSPSSDDFLLSCMVWCGKCGRKMTQARTKNRFTPGKKVRAYRCTGNVPNRRNKTGCASSLGAIRLEADAWSKVLALLLEPDLLEMHLANLESSRSNASLVADLASAEKKRKQIERQVRSVVDAQQDASSRLVQKTLKDKLVDLDVEASRIDEQIALLKSRIAAFDSAGQTISSFRAKVGSLRALAAQSQLTYEDKRKILVSLGTRVIGLKGSCRVEIEVEDAVRRHYADGGSGTSVGVVVSLGAIAL